MAAIYEFPNEISCNKAISWSPDNRICLCTDTAIKILSLKCGVDNTENKVKCHQTSFPVYPDILDIPQFTVAEHKFLIKNLSREELKILTVERVLNPWKYQIETVPRTGFAAADWSPLGADGFGRSILATLSQDYRLCLYSHEPSQNEWSLVCDLSVLRCTQEKPEFVLQSIDDYNKYKDWCFSQAVTVMKWGPSVLTDSSNGQKYTVLATGTKSGHIAMWKVNMPYQNKSDCSVMCSVQPSECQISGLQWSQQSELLTVSYVDGKIQALKFNTKDHTQKPTCLCVYSEPDLMKVSSMCILENIKSDVYVLLANKEQCMVALQLNKDTHAVISQTHTFLQNVRPAAGMCIVTNSSILMMSLDAMLQKITVTIDDGDMKLLSELVMDLSVNAIWVSHGLCLSPNRMLTAFVVRPRPGFDHLAPPVRKAATKVHIRYLDNFNIGTHCQEECVTKLCKSGADGSLLDVIELYRQMVLNMKFKLEDTVGESGKVCLRKLKLIRYAVMLRYSFRKEREPGEKSGEDLKKEKDDPLPIIIAMYIKSSVQNIDMKNMTSEPNRDRNLEVVSGMLCWLKGNSEGLREVEDMTVTKQCLEEILSKADKERCIPCCICSNKMHVKQFQWLCGNGHSFDICCKTLLPVEGVNYRTCTVCYSHARPPELFKGLQWLSQDCTRCTFCDGLMLP